MSVLIYTSINNTFDPLCQSPLTAKNQSQWVAASYGAGCNPCISPSNHSDGECHCCLNCFYMAWPGINNICQTINSYSLITTPFSPANPVVVRCAGDIVDGSMPPIPTPFLSWVTALGNRPENANNCSCVAAFTILDNYHSFLDSYIHRFSPSGEAYMLVSGVVIWGSDGTDAVDYYFSALYYCQLMDCGGGSFNLVSDPAPLINVVYPGFGSGTCDTFAENIPQTIQVTGCLCSDPLISSSSSSYSQS